MSTGGIPILATRVRLARDVQEALREVERAEREEQEVRERLKREGESGILLLKLKRCELFRKTCYRELAEAEAKLNQLAKN